MRDTTNRTLVCLIVLASIAVAGVCSAREPERRLASTDLSPVQSSAADPRVRAVAATCRVRVPQGNGYSQGSGTFLGSRLVITAAHVIEGGDARNTTCDFGRGPIRCVGFTKNTQADQFILQLAEDPGVDPVPLATSAPKFGERVYGLGYGGQGFGVWEANKREYASAHSPSSWYETASCVGDSPIPGDSGGGVFNANWEYVGTVWGGLWDARPARASYVRYDETRRFLDRGGLIRGIIWGRGGSGPNCPDGSCPQPPQPNCPDGNCPQPDLAPQQPDSLVGPRGEPGPPGPQGPAGPMGPSGRDAEVTPEQLAAIAGEIAKQLKADPSMRGPQGPRGPAGKNAAIDYDELIAELRTRLPPLTLRLRDGAGNVIDEDSVPIGGTLDLQFVEAD